MARVNEKVKAWQKPAVLENAVLRDNPNEVLRLFKELGKVDFTARALGYACRYRGLEMVRALVEGGAKFSYDLELIKQLYRRANRNIEILYEDENYAAALLISVGLAEMRSVYRYGKAYNRPMLPINDRLRILDYLCKTADKTDLDMDELLFYAYFSGDDKIISFLKKKGAVIPERWIKIVTEGSGDDKWLNYCYLTQQLDDDGFIRTMNALIGDIGADKKLHFTELFWDYNEKRLGKPGFFKFLLKNFNQSKMNKTKLLKKIIDCGNVESLAFCAENGWLKQPRKRDEMIQYSTEHESAECTAWLLDFKNRTADLAAERAKAAKKAERELNADPNSVTELKKIWRYEKREDGSFMITGYKGDRTEIVIPEKIGKGIVTAIGERAFSPNALRLTEEQVLNRCRISKVTVPPSVTTIEKNAFGGVGVVKGNFNAYSLLEEVILPASLEMFASKEAAETAPIIFVNCPMLTVKIPHTPYAEIFCRRNRVNFESV